MKFNFNNSLQLKLNCSEFKKIKIKINGPRVRENTASQKVEIINKIQINK